MSVLVEVKGAEQVVQHLGQLDERLRASLRRAVVEGAIDVQQRTQEKLAGEVLNERTHHLHDSIHHLITRDDDQAIVATVGTDVVYAAIHEYGFSGVEQVREHLRTITQAFGRPIAPRQVHVAAHERQMRMPERSFMRSSLAELAPAIRAHLQGAVAEAVQ